MKRRHVPDSMRHAPVKPTLFRWSIVSCLQVCVVGCADLLTPNYHAAYRTPPERLREVEAVELSALSRSEPVTVEEAAAETAESDVAEREPAQSIEMTLTDVRAAALANNLDLKVEVLNPSIAEQTIAEEEARFEPLLFGSAELDQVDLPSTSIDAPPQRSRLVSYDTGLQIPLRTGGTVTASLPFNKFSNDTESDSYSGDAPEVINPLYQTGLELSIKQPLLRGAGVRVNTHPIRLAMYREEMALARTKLEAIRILANADRAYWILYAARAELAVAQEQLDLALRQLDQAERRVAAGAAPKIEIMRAESGLARRREAIIIADTEVRRYERELKRIMNRDGLAINSPTALLPQTEPSPVHLDLDADALADRAVDNRMELLELELQLAVDASTIDFERSATLPLFTLDYSYTIHGLAGSFNDAFRDLGDGSFADSSLGVSVEIPIGNRAAKSRLRRAVLERVQRLATRDQRRLAIRQEVYDALDQLEQNWQRILAAGKEVVLAEQTWKAEQSQFDVGLRTSTEVLEAAARVADAKSRRIRALAAYEISQVDIAFATGALLGGDYVIWDRTRID